MKPERFDPTRYLVAPELQVDEARVAAFEALWQTIDARPALGKLLVGPEDFPFLDQVQGFRPMDILRPVVIVVWRQLWHQVRSWFSSRGRHLERDGSGRKGEDKGGPR